MNLPDRLEVNAQGQVAVIDYKTGRPPNFQRIEAGYGVQLGLLAVLLEKEEPQLHADLFRYWQLSGGAQKPGVESNPLSVRRVEQMDAATFKAKSLENYCEAVARYILGDEAFLAKVHNIYAQSYSDYDHLARVSEWLGRR